jgi:hypothetical protein
MRTISTHHNPIRRRARVPVRICLLALAMLLVPSSLVGMAKARVPHNFFGIDDPLQVTPHAVDLKRMHRGHVGWVHTGFEWSNLEPRRGDFNWSRSDQIIGDLASRGIRVLPFLCGSPRYAAEAQNRPPLGSKAARRAWKGFLRAIVGRYGPGGEYWTDPDLYAAQHPEGPIVPVRRWQIWHQPNSKKLFSPVSARKYAKLVRISHRPIRHADPHAKIVLAGLVAYAKHTAWSFLNQLYRVKGIKRDFDAVALHPFASNVRYQARALKRTRRVITRHHDGHTPIWITTLGWGSGHVERFGLNKGLEGQAHYLKKSFRMVLDHRREWHIKRVFWFRWRDPSPSATDARCSRGITCTAGLFRASGKPKPAWRAFRRFAR